ncbi:MAG: AAA family ATPase [Peptostreptococcaceae bacterium]
MKINKLTLKNFRSYEKETVFDFSTTDEKNIILVGGKNGAGKSTIFEAIKLCIYGPSAYKYQGFNSSYIGKVKSNINNNSLKNDIVNSYVSVDLEINEGTEKNIYSIVRKWTFINKKLSENVLIYKNFSNIALNDDEVNYFENYITSIISPKIFDFFFFDGEYLSEFFIGKNSNSHLKESLLSLCNFDTFEILKNTVISNNKYDKNNPSQIDIAKDEYLELEKNLDSMNIEFDEFNNKYKDIKSELEGFEQQKIKLETNFRKKGGILAEERDLLNSKIIELESRRQVINQEIKDFCNEILPFLIIKDQLIITSNNLKTESNNVLFNNLKEKLDIKYITNLLSTKINNNILSEVALTVSDELIKDIKPKNYDENFDAIHNLSNDESNTINSLISNILEFDNINITKLFNEQSEIASNLSEIRTKLNSSLDNSYLNDYVLEIENISNNIFELSKCKDDLSFKIHNLEHNINEITINKEKAKSRYIDLVKSNNVIDMSSSIILMLEDIINTLTVDKITQISSNFMNIFKNIMQKNNFIDFIDINTNFNVSLYINKIYNSNELENLIQNIGYDEIDKKLGNLFIKDLEKLFNTSNKKDLINNIKEKSISDIKLRTKVDINGFSSGEKQIYILCLYWALIKSSDINIPFIIDTPYARIDETHRNNITEKYFSTISTQVIILSTNTEIDEKAYKEIKQKLNGEYLIKYDEVNRNTIQTKGYFFEV